GTRRTGLRRTRVRRTRGTRGTGRAGALLGGRFRFGCGTLGGADLDHAVHRIGGDLVGEHLAVGHLAVDEAVLVGDGALAVAALLGHAGLVLVELVGLPLHAVVLDRGRLGAGLGAVPHDGHHRGAVGVHGDDRLVLATEGDLRLPQHLLQGGAAVDVDGALLVVHHDRRRAVGDQRQVELGASVAGPGGLEGGVPPAAEQLGECFFGGQGGGPDGALLTVGGDGDLLAGAHHHVGTVAQCFLRARDDRVVRAELD